MVLRDRLRAQKAAVESVWTQFQSTPADTALRPELRESWERSQQVVDLNIKSAPETETNWEDNPLAQPVTELEASLSDLATEGGFVVAVTDNNSRILWTAGSSHMRNKAARANFTAGSDWSESAVGTNALDLALRTQTQQSVFSAEHFAPLVHGWVCYAAPIFDRKNETCLGVIDISTTWDNANPLALMAVTSFADLISAEVTNRSSQHQPITLSVLGKPQVQIGSGNLNLPRRQLEILFLLSLHPQGMTLDELHSALYADESVSTGTLKAELSNLRQVLGGQIESRPYRLTAPIRSDYEVCVRELKVGRFDLAIQAFRGELLGTSNSPEIEARREHLMAALHMAALQTTNLDAILEYLDKVPHDLAVCEHLSSLVRTSDPRFAITQAALLKAQRC